MPESNKNMAGIEINSLYGKRMFPTYKEFRDHHKPTVGQFIYGYAVVIGHHLVTAQLPTPKHAWASLKRQYYEQKSIINWLETHQGNPGWGKETSHLTRYSG